MDMRVDPERAFLKSGLHGSLLLLAAVSFSAALLAADGERIYRERCASCHGASGEGVEGGYSRPLAGTKSVAALARYIERSMPEDAPEACTGEDAEVVARYVYDTFYSPIAQARRRPARVELARLTVGQHRNALADLIGSFRPPAKATAERGLRAEYFNSRRPGRDRVIERVDPQLDFDFGRSTPVPEELGSQGFAARWEGALHVHDTGAHEVVIRTDHGARLWVNDFEEPLIDAWVKSGSDTEYHASIFLVGGRTYPLRLEFTSRRQGVADKDKPDPEPVKGFVALAWKPPGRALEVVPSRHLSPVLPPEVFTLAAPFPSDDRSDGYERGTSVSKAWSEAVTAAAIEAARYITVHLGELSSGQGAPPDEHSRLQDFCRSFVERAFRRPLREEERRIYIDRRFEEAGDPRTAVKEVVLLALQSPRFLLLDFGGNEPDGYDIASRLSFALWDSIPDGELLDAAATGHLASREEVARQAERMVSDPRARSKVREFFHHWLEIEHAPDLAKDPERFPEFDAEVASDLRTSLDLFLDEVVWGDDPDFRRVLLSRELYANGRLARYYGFDLPEEAPFQKLVAEEIRRAGVLTHPYVLARFAYTDTTSPIHRGVFLVRNVLGRPLRPPPDAFAPLSPDLHPDLTTRERVALQTRPEACQSCHAKINPLGFALEQFDADGRYREIEKGKRIDAAGTYELPGGESLTFTGAGELAEALAASEEVHRGFATALFQHLVKQPLLAYGVEEPERLARFLAGHEFNIRKLLVEITTTAALASPVQAGDGAARDSPARARRRVRI